MPTIRTIFRSVRRLETGDKLTIRELIKEQRALVDSGNPMKRLAAAMLIPAVLAERLAGLADRQVGQLLLDEVSPRLSPLHPESVLPSRRGSAPRPDEEKSELPEVRLGDDPPHRDRRA